MTAIHWVHAGPDAIDGVTYLRNAGADPVIWTRPDTHIAGLGGNHTTMDADAFARQLRPGDVVIAARPTDLGIARIAMQAGAHMAVAWHVSKGLRDVVSDAAEKGIAVLAEVGMAPGIDHLMARDLVNDYRAVAQQGDVLHFLSYGGGMPKYPDNFRHKFNASPLSLLNALASPVSWIENGKPARADFAFDAIRAFDLNLPVPERHQVYPHYDVTPYLEAYGFDPDWTIASAERGSIRLKGWDEGWARVFDHIRATGKDADALARLSQELWDEHPFQPGEADRVVLSVALRAEQNGKTRWHKEWILEASGGRKGFVRARLNSVMLALGALGLASGKIAPGLHIGPTDPDLIASWLIEIAEGARHAQRINHLRVEPETISPASA